MPPDSDVRVPDESLINHPMPSDFQINNQTQGAEMFKKRPTPVRYMSPQQRATSVQRIPLNVDTTPMKINEADEDIAQKFTKSQMLQSKNEIKRPSLVVV